MMRDAKMIQIYEGSAQVMRIIIARHLLQEIEKRSERRVKMEGGGTGAMSGIKR